MHGGAKGSGAPLSNTNALKHGAYTKPALQRRAEMRGMGVVESECARASCMCGQVNFGKHNTAGGNPRTRGY